MTYLSILVFMLIISSGSIFASAFYNRKYEEILPLTCSAIVAILFMFGMFKSLYIGTIVIIICSCLLYILSIINVIKNKTIKLFIKNTFTLGFVAYVLLSAFMLFTISGKLFNAWDEFSHWGDIVKVMCEIDDFGTNPVATSEFKSYPPGMALFQYFLEKINLFITGKQFVEWLCNYSYSMVMFSFLMPIFSLFKNNRIIPTFLLLISFISIPFVFYDYLVFKEVLIDPYLSFLLCSGMLNLFWNKDNNILNRLNIYCVLFSLVLAKDTGLIFAIFIGVAFIIEQCTYSKTWKNNNRLIYIITICALSIALPKILWNINIMINDVPIMFNGKIDFRDLFNVVTGRVYSYRTDTIINYFKAFVEEKLLLENFNINTNYIITFMVSYVCIFLIYLFNKDENNLNKKLTTITFIMLSIIFVVGMCVIYMYKFSEFEAVRHASFNRYHRIVLLAIWLYISISVLLTTDKANTPKIYILFTMLLFVISPIKTIKGYISREHVNTSIAIRDSYQELINKTLNNCEANTKVWFISQGNTGYEVRYFHTAVRPVLVDYYNASSITNVENCSKEYYNYLTSNDWRNRLLSDNYDYVAIYELDDDFYIMYSDMFENDVEIKENSLYKVNRKNGKLSLCE